MPDGGGGGILTSPAGRFGATFCGIIKDLSVIFCLITDRLQGPGAWRPGRWGSTAALDNDTVVVKIRFSLFGRFNEEHHFDFGIRIEVFPDTVDGIEASSGLLGKHVDGSGHALEFQPEITIYTPPAYG